MEHAARIAVLKRLVEESKTVTTRKNNDATFRTWQNTVERGLLRVFGENSTELGHFKRLPFFYRGVRYSAADYTQADRNAFERDFQILTESLKRYVQELETEVPTAAGTPSPELRGIQRVFVSHASADSPIVEELIELLEIVGLTNEHIFCTSFPGYDIDLGDNFLDAIKSELLNADALVLFLLTPNFFRSPISLCEMGATWVLAKEHIPIIVPPLDFSDVKGVVPLTQGFRLNEPLKLNMLKEKIEAVFGLQSSQSQSAWERRRDRVVERINAKIAATGV
jgi:hypothetical protein